MDIYEIYSNARENLKIQLNRTEKEVHDGEYFNMLVEISNPPRSIFSFLKEPSYAYDDVILKVRENRYTRPMDRSFVEGYRIEHPINPNDRITIKVPLEAKMDLPRDFPAEDIMQLIVEADLKTDDLFRFTKGSEGGADNSPPP